jgi:hypothetical protein
MQTLSSRAAIGTALFLAFLTRIFSSHTAYYAEVKTSSMKTDQ